MGKTVEIKASQYYIYRSYVSTYYYVYMRLEEWLKEIIFRNDESRTFLASDEYAFRRRFELTDTSKSYNDVEASSLQFPFANYWPLNTGWQPDTRIVANPAALVYAGVYEGDTKIRAASVALPISITFYYDREDDARMAYEKLLFYTYNEHYYDINVPYAGNTLGIPFILRVNNLRFNPTFNETDWLNKNRIFTISVEFDIRTYVLYPPEQPDYDVEVDADGMLSTGNEYDDGYGEYYITEEVILNMVNRGDSIVSTIKVNGTYDEDAILINQLSIEDIDSISATIKWKVENADKLSKIEIQSSNSPLLIELDPSTAQYVLSDLNENSLYDVTIIFYSNSGTTKKFTRTFETISDEIEDNSGIKEPEDSLVGLEW